jgi:hypothetical protein
VPPISRLWKHWIILNGDGAGGLKQLISNEIVADLGIDGPAV